MRKTRQTSGERIFKDIKRKTRKRIGSTLRNLFSREAVKEETTVQLKLDRTPSGAEEARDFQNQKRAMGVPCNEDDAKFRIDKLARRLARVWTAFLMYIVIAQGIKDGASFEILGCKITYIPKFNLETAEFIAVFITTTASVFAFLVIVANYLFKRRV